MDLSSLKALTAQYLPLVPSNSPPVRRGLIFGMTVPTEVAGFQLASDLAQTGYTKLSVYKARAFLFKKWQLAGLSTPVEYTPAAIHEWLDRIDSIAHSHGAKLETWAPSV